MKKVLFALFAVSMLAACQTEETAPVQETTDTSVMTPSEESTENDSQVVTPEVEKTSEECCE